MLPDGARSPLSAQRLDWWLDASAAHALPPADVAGAGTTTFGLFGTRLSLEGAVPRTIVDLALYGGRGTTAADGTWLSGALGVGMVRRIGIASAGGRAELFGLDYREPFSYTATGATLTPHLSIPIGAVMLTGRGEWTRGHWSTPSTDTLVPGAASGALAVAGGALTLGLPLNAAWLEMTGEGYSARNGAAPGSYRGLGATLGFAGGKISVAVGGSAWGTPTGAEVGFHGSFQLQVAERLAAQLLLGRSVTDRLYGSPGSFTASVGLRWRLATSEVPRSPAVVEVTEAAERGRIVRFRLPAAVATQAAISGDFTGWEPRSMRRLGDAWLIELVLAPGLHHFGFLLDGKRWYVPDDAPGLTDDGWGRRNASLVVEHR